jgi:hypothetical protein
VPLFPSGEGIPACVLDLRFLDDVALVEIAVQGLDPLFARMREGDGPELGREIGAGVDGGAVGFEVNGNSSNCLAWRPRPNPLWLARARALLP